MTLCKMMQRLCQCCPVLLPYSPELLLHHTLSEKNLSIKTFISGDILCRICSVLAKIEHMSGIGGYLRSC